VPRRRERDEVHARRRHVPRRRDGSR
jgi:hypothetical protein